MSSSMLERGYWSSPMATKLIQMRATLWAKPENKRPAPLEEDVAMIETNGKSTSVRFRPVILPRLYRYTSVGNDHADPARSPSLS